MSNLSYVNTYPLHGGHLLSFVPKMIASWLKRWWLSECRRAEQPGRIVPYY